MRKSGLWAAMLAAVLVASPAHADPFGIRKGQPVSSLKVTGQPDLSNRFVYMVVPPKPNPEGEKYYVVATPQTGVCKVIMVGKRNFNDTNAVVGTSIFDKISKLISTKYGRPVEEEFRGSTYWGVGFWGLGKGMTSEIKSIRIDLERVSDSENFVRVTYGFANVDACQAVVDSAGL